MRDSAGQLQTLFDQRQTSLYVPDGCPVYGFSFLALLRVRFRPFPFAHAFSSFPSPVSCASSRTSLLLLVSCVSRVRFRLFPCRPFLAPLRVRFRPFPSTVSCTLRVPVSLCRLLRLFVFARPSLLRCSSHTLFASRLRSLLVSCVFLSFHVRLWPRRHTFSFSSRTLSCSRLSACAVFYAWVLRLSIEGECRVFSETYYTRSHFRMLCCSTDRTVCFSVLTVSMFLRLRNRKTKLRKPGRQYYSSLCWFVTVTFRVALY